MPYLIILVVFVLARFFNLCLLYALKTPNGSVLTESGVFVLIKRSIAADFTALGFITVLFLIISLILKRKKRILLIIQTSIFGLYLLLSIFDSELIRWLSRRFTIGYFKTYAGAVSDLNLVSNIIQGGLFSFVLNAAILFFALITSYFVLKKIKFDFHTQKNKLIAGLILILLSIFAMQYAFYKPLKDRQRRDRIRPFYTHIYNEIIYSKTHKTKPNDYEKGIVFLGGNPKAKYPFLKVESSNISAFKSLDINEKPDIIFLTIESLRGWVFDIRTLFAQEKLPNYIRLAKKGIYFPYTYSVGFPSTEGLLGMQSGIWSHTEKYFATYEYNAKGLPEVLGEAGYNRIVIPGANPNFDNFTPVFEKWYDKIEYHKDIHNDIPLAKKFVEVYQQRDKAKPLFLNWMSSTTHSPFLFPKELGKTPDENYERYDSLAVYLDKALGIILDAIEKDPRKENTIIILSGDHSFATGIQKERLDKVGNAHSGRVWTNLIITGKNIPQDSVNLNFVSHADIAPTLLNLLNIKVQNNFVGVDLLVDNQGPKFSFVQQDLALHFKKKHIYANINENDFVVLKALEEPSWDTEQVSKGFVGEDFLEPTKEDSLLADSLRAAAKAWTYVLDNNLLYKEEK